MWKAWEKRLNELCISTIICSPPSSLENNNDNENEPKPKLRACPGAIELIKVLYEQKKIPMAIATSSRTLSVEKKKKYYRKTIFDKMTFVLCGDDPCVKNGKPAPDMYIEAAKRLGYKTSECLVVEDSYQGMLAGKRAGCHVLGVPDSRMFFSDDTSENTQLKLIESCADEISQSLSEFDVDRWFPTVT